MVYLLNNQTIKDISLTAMGFGVLPDKIASGLYHESVQSTCYLAVLAVLAVLV